jgi:SacI homology domain
VAHIHGKPIFVITEVALTPLTSRREAETAVEHTQTSLQKHTVDKSALGDSDTDEDEGEGSAAASDDVDDDETSPLGVGNTSIDSAIKDMGHNRRSSIAEDVITRKGGYGRFAQKWFSGKGWTVNQRRTLGMSAAEAETINDAPTGDLAVTDTQGSESSNTPVTGGETDGISAVKRRDVAATLLPKLLRTTRLLFGSSRSFYFSYDYDITRNFANRGQYHASDVPLHKDVDPLFFWNQNVIQPFIDAGQYSYVLPLMQGFVAQRSFAVEKHPTFPEYAGNASSTVLEMKEMTPENERRSPEPSIPTDTNTHMDGSTDRTAYQNISSTLGSVKHVTSHSTSTDETRSFLLTLISRRSVKRAGLRYLRRGVDDDGDTANGVETEQILSSTDWSLTSKIYSYLQIRGSIPLFFSQSPYSFKPVPQLQKSAETNFRAFKKHFSALSARYGSLQVASLVERHGVEAHIGEEYEKNVTRLNESGGIDGAKVGFEWFDFHAICRGMKFENVSILMDTLGSTLDAFGTTIEKDSKLVERQNGILRTNCMDCLDRTNVVQSACGRRALEMQLKEEGFDLSSQVDQTTEWFNTLWADNGDAISKQYASTAALKGDFTRTRKRNYKGALTDMGLSITRFYSG